MSRDRQTSAMRIVPDERGQALIRKKRGQDMAEARQDVRNKRDAMGANPSVRDLRDMVESLWELVEVLSERIK